MQVPAADGKLRFWRNTTRRAAWRPAQTATLGTGTVGYEWDEDVDNGFRPRRPDPAVHDRRHRRRSVLQDYGSTYGTGTATHSLTLYRARQRRAGVRRRHRAVVVGPGQQPRPRRRRAARRRRCSRRPSTCSPTWASSRRPCSRAGRRDGVDRHDGADLRRSPRRPAGASVQPAAPITITGTATDTGGGVVGGSRSPPTAGRTWHPATGRDDLDLHLDARGARGRHDQEPRGRRQRQHRERRDRRSVTVAPRDLPVQHLGSGADAGRRPPTPTPAPIELGVKFRSDVDRPGHRHALLQGHRQHRHPRRHLWTATGTQLATRHVHRRDGDRLAAGDLRRPRCRSPPAPPTSPRTSPRTAATPRTTSYFPAAAVDAPRCTRSGDGTDGPNGVYRYGTGGGFPTQRLQCRQLLGRRRVHAVQHRRPTPRRRR